MWLKKRVNHVNIVMIQEEDEDTEIALSTSTECQHLV